MSPDDVPAEWVELAAHALYKARSHGDDEAWDEVHANVQDGTRECARAILAAVLPSAQAEAWKQGALTADPNLDPSVADEYNPYREGSTSL